MQEFAQSIVETIRHPLLVLDSDLIVQSANAAFCRKFDLAASDTIGRLVFDLDERQWDIPWLQTLLSVVRLGNSFEDFEVRQDFPRLGPRVMLLNARRVHREEDATAMILLAIEDVTDKIQAQDDLARLNRELEDRVRERTAELQAANDELAAFCYSVSHDLRAPLRAVDGFSEELLRGYGEALDEKGRHYLRRVRAGTQQMGRLIDDMLRLSRFSRAEMTSEQVDLTALARPVAAELSLLDPGGQVCFDIQTDLTGQGDPALLKVVVENLLGNAWKFTGKEARPTITMGRTEYQGRPAFFIRDDGAGFDMQHAGKLFGAFQRLHPQRDFPGNGIGLATVQRIIHRHGGQVWAESSPGKGATFFFTLPVQEQPMKESA